MYQGEPRGMRSNERSHPRFIATALLLVALALCLGATAATHSHEFHGDLGVGVECAICQVAPAGQLQLACLAGVVALVAPTALAIRARAEMPLRVRARHHLAGVPRAPPTPIVP